MIKLKSVTNSLQTKFDLQTYSLTDQAIYSKNRQDRTLTLSSLNLHEDAGQQNNSSTCFLFDQRK